jgi:Zn-dependent M28 family amino/carboxypeptidase
VATAIVIVAGNYDTKRSSFPFVGANNGGSSPAFLLEMARVLARRKNSLSYWLVFFDGEEALQRWSNTDSLYGSRHLAQELLAQRTLNQSALMGFLWIAGFVWYAPGTRRLSALGRRWDRAL